MPNSKKDFFIPRTTKMMNIIINSCCFEKTNLLSIVIPYNVAEIDNYVFYGSYLQIIEIEENSK